MTRALAVAAAAAFLVGVWRAIAAGEDAAAPWIAASAILVILAGVLVLGAP